MKKLTMCIIIIYLHTSSQIDDSLTSGLLIRSEIKSTTSWLLNEFQIPSQANTRKFVLSGVMSKTVTSGKAVIICSVFGRSLFFL